MFQTVVTALETLQLEKLFKVMNVRNSGKKVAAVASAQFYFWLLRYVIKTEKNRNNCAKFGAAASLEARVM